MTSTGRVSIATMALVLGGLMMFALATRPAQASSEPVLSAVSFSPSTVTAGQTSTLSFTATNAVSVEAVFFRLPDGTSGSLPMGSFTQVGTTFSGAVSVPANALGGVWRISELGVRNNQNVTYRFEASDLFASTSACPTFDNAGVFICGSTIVRDNGRLSVQQSATVPLPTATHVADGNELIRVTAGANLVAWPTADTDVETALRAFSRPVIAVYEFNSASRSWRRFFPRLPAFMNNLNRLRAGAAYWVMSE